MKIAIKDIDHTADVISLKAITESSITDQRLIWVDSEASSFMYAEKMGNGDYAPNDQTNNRGFWVRDPMHYSAYLSLVDDGYDFAGNASTDISSITNYHEQGEECGMDYKAVRAKMTGIAYTLTSGFTDMAQLTINEKRYCAERFAMPITEVSTELGADFDYYLNDWIARSKEARLYRWEQSKIQSFNCYGEQNAKIELKAIEAEGLGPAYLEGIEGTLEDNVEGLFDYIESRAGTTYELTGWKAKNYTPINQMTNQEAIDSIMNVLQNGDL